MKLSGMSNGDIVSELKREFSSEELDRVSKEIDKMVVESETLDQLKDKISKYLYFEIYL